MQRKRKQDNSQFYGAERNLPRIHQLYNNKQQLSQPFNEGRT